MKRTFCEYQRCDKQWDDDEQEEIQVLRCDLFAKEGSWEEYCDCDEQEAKECMLYKYKKLKEEIERLKENKLTPDDEVEVCSTGLTVKEAEENLYKFSEALHKEANKKREKEDEILDNLEGEKKDNFTGWKMYQDGKEVCSMDCSAEEEKKIPEKIEYVVTDENGEFSINGFTFDYEQKMQIIDTLNQVIDYLESKERGE